MYGLVHIRALFGLYGRPTDGLLIESPDEIGGMLPLLPEHPTESGLEPSTALRFMTRESTQSGLWEAANGLPFMILPLDLEMSGLEPNLECSIAHWMM